MRSYGRVLRNLMQVDIYREWAIPYWIFPKSESVSRSKSIVWGR